MRAEREVWYSWHQLVADVRRANVGAHVFGPQDHHWKLGRGPIGLGLWRQEHRRNKTKIQKPLTAIEPS